LQMEAQVLINTEVNTSFDKPGLNAMKQLIQPIQDILTARVGVKNPASPVASSSESVDLKGVQTALESFDSYLNSHLKSQLNTQAQTGSLLKKDHSVSSKEAALDTATLGKNRLLSGNDLPLSSVEASQSAGYITAAQNLVDDLSSKMSSTNDQTVEASEDSYGLFESPIYQSLIGNDVDEVNLSQKVETTEQPELFNLAVATQPTEKTSEIAKHQASTDLGQPQESQSRLSPLNDGLSALSEISRRLNTDIVKPSRPVEPINVSDRNAVRASTANPVLIAEINQTIKGLSPDSFETNGSESIDSVRMETGIKTPPELRAGTERLANSGAINSDIVDEILKSGYSKGTQHMVNQTIPASPSNLFLNLSVPGATGLFGYGPVTEGQIEADINSFYSFEEDSSQVIDEMLDLGRVKESSLSSLTAGAKNLDSNHQALNTTSSQIFNQGLNQTSGQDLRLKMDTPVMQDGWNREFAMKVRTLASFGEQQASLQLNPSELGSIEITMTTEADRAKVHFFVQSAGARETLENSLPKLREFFEESGMTLSDTGIEDQSARSGFTEQHNQEQSDSSVKAPKEPEVATSDSLSTDVNSETLNGRLNNTIDYYI